MKRRGFLLLGGSAAALVAAGVWTGYQRPRAEAPGTLLKALATGMTGVAAAGRAWLDAHPGQEADQLAQSLLNRLQVDETVMTADALIDRLARQIELELADLNGWSADASPGSDRIVQLDGWLLASTEMALAGLHVLLLGPAASEAAEVGFEHARIEFIAEVSGPTPRSMAFGGEPRHPALPDSVLWFDTPNLPAHITLMLAGRTLFPSARPTGFSVRLPPAIIELIAEQAGEHEIWLYDPVRQLRQQLSSFTVDRPEAAPSPEGFCAIERWGPDRTTAGEVFNMQPDGSAAFWIRTPCAPPGTVVLFGDTELATTVQHGLVTARVVDPLSYQYPGTVELRLYDPGSDSYWPVGEFQINPP